MAKMIHLLLCIFYHSKYRSYNRRKLKKEGPRGGGGRLLTPLAFSFVFFPQIASLDPTPWIDGSALTALTWGGPITPACHSEKKQGVPSYPTSLHLGPHLFPQLHSYFLEILPSSQSGLSVANALTSKSTPQHCGGQESNRPRSAPPFPGWHRHHTSRRDAM